MNVSEFDFVTIAKSISGIGQWSLVEVSSKPDVATLQEDLVRRGHMVRVRASDVGNGWVAFVLAVLEWQEFVEATDSSNTPIQILKYRSSKTQQVLRRSNVISDDEESEPPSSSTSQSRGKMVGYLCAVGDNKPAGTESKSKAKNTKTNANDKQQQELLEDGTGANEQWHPDWHPGWCEQVAQPVIHHHDHWQAQDEAEEGDWQWQQGDPWRWQEDEWPDPNM